MSNSLSRSIANIDERIEKLSASENFDEMNDLIRIRERLTEVQSIRSVDRNQVLQVAGKVLISGIVFAIERNGVLTSKIPIPSFIK